jgi:hypothetical protein
MDAPSGHTVRGCLVAHLSNELSKSGYNMPAAQFMFGNPILAIETLK